MSYQVLARKWRPRCFSDVRGQDHITRTLINSITSRKIAHAYLLTGTRGIGKTTIARIFAKAIRCENLSSTGEPCLECISCTTIDSGNSLDYLEIDGASNNSVEDIRELISSVQYLPTSGQYKVYVIDEVHMLTVNAFNALLKTLEEPPDHAVFIFATTDPQKLLGTVLSRCQRFDFKNSSLTQTKALLLEIAAKEGIRFEHDWLVSELAKRANGSFRDSLSLFDQVISLSSSEMITEESLMLSLGIARTKAVDSLVNAILGKKRSAVITSFESVINENVDLKIFSKQILDRIYDLLTSVDDEGKIDTTKLDGTIVENLSLVELFWVYETLTKDLEWALNSFDPEKICCFVFVKAAIRDKIVTQDSAKLEIKKKQIIEKDEVVEPVKLVEPAKVIEAVVPVEIKQSVEKTWPEFIRYLYEKNKTIAVNLERGNLIGENEQLENLREYKVAFTQECKFFYEFLKDEKRFKELQVLLAEFISRPLSELKIHFSLMDDETKEINNFKSAVEVEESEIQKVKDEKTQAILNNKFIKDAEKIFDTKVGRVVLTEND